MIVNEQSLGGRVALVTASKGALHQLTSSLAAELALRAITVNTVNPGETDTGYATIALHNAILAQEPMGRWGTPDDAARLIGWPATDAAQWITGQVINSTGGGPWRLENSQQIS